jgi:hypothetical protein
MNDDKFKKLLGHFRKSLETVLPLVSSEDGFMQAVLNAIEATFLPNLSTNDSEERPGRLANKGDGTFADLHRQLALVEEEMIRKAGQLKCAEKEVVGLRRQLRIGADTLGRERAEWIRYKNGLMANELHVSRLFAISSVLGALVSEERTGREAGQSKSR